MSGLKGDVRKLSRLARSLPSKVVSQRVAAKVAPEITNMALATFRAGSNAYGDTWAPGHDGKPVTMVRSGKLMATLLFVAIGTRVRARLGVPYARYQIGKRAILPPGGRSMPTGWARAVKDISIREIQAGMPRSI